MQKRTPRPYYPIGKVRQLALLGLENPKYCFVNAIARNDAKKHFGWRVNDVLKAVSRLKTVHFYKKDKKYDNPSLMVDYYKAYGLLGEDVYFHFRIEDERLVICSCKRI